ncbi:MAG: hypothetical protein MZV64_72915 [Ignavibacteriales bacterium]|nr:hypothetical protein [Ignavibacteriales bacterium]
MTSHRTPLLHLIAGRRSSAAAPRVRRSLAAAAAVVAVGLLPAAPPGYEAATRAHRPRAAAVDGPAVRGHAAVDRARSRCSRPRFWHHHYKQGRGRLGAACFCRPVPRAVRHRSRPSGLLEVLLHRLRPVPHPALGRCTPSSGGIYLRGHAQWPRPALNAGVPRRRALVAGVADGHHRRRRCC